MKKIKSVYRKHKWLFVTLSGMGIIMTGVYTATLGASSGFNAVIFQLNDWVTSHHLFFRLWHFLLIAAIHWGYRIKIKKSTKAKQLSTHQVTQLKRLGWVLVTLLLAINGWVLLRS